MINYDLTKIRAMAFDVDGVLASPLVMLIGDQLVRTANTKDGYAMQLAVKCGYQMAIITGGKGEALVRRYESLGFQDVYTQCSVKTEVLDEWMAKHDLKPEEVLYMGDDIPDYEAMRRVGCSCCPADAAPEIREIATYVSHVEGGKGCARDVIEQVLRASDHWMQGAKAFGW